MTRTATMKHTLAIAASAASAAASSVATSVSLSALANQAQAQPARLQQQEQSCCQLLESAGLEHVLYPDSDAYQNRTESYFSVSSQLAPFCIAQPTSPQDVSLILKTLINDTDCELAVRSGGHTVWPANNIDNGVTIDMGLMTDIEYVSENKVAKVHAGARWRDVYGALEPYGVTAAGGRTSTVGVSGFLTGGGNTFYTARRGFGCDNVVNFEVVLANGDIINANAQENGDLFKALKGGSTNFGLVTRFDLQAFDAPELWGGLVTYPTSVTDQHIDAYHNWTNNIENYMDGSVIPFWTYLPDTDEISITVAYEDTTGLEAPPAFDQFLAIPDNTSSTMRIDTHRNLAVELELTSGYRNVWFAIAFKNDKALYKKALDMHKEFVANWKAQSPDGDFICHGIFQALPTIFSTHSIEKGGNMLGLDREVDNAVLFQVQLMVNGVEQEEEGRRRMVEFRETLKQYSVDEEGGVDWEYLNYADFTQDPLKSYGPGNVEHIRAVAAKYDPHGVFQTRFPKGFKISNVE